MRTLINPAAALPIVALFTAVLAVHAGTAQAAPCTVPSGSHPTIQSAVGDPACDPINVNPGAYAEVLAGVGQRKTVDGDIRRLDRDQAGDG